MKVAGRCAARKKRPAAAARRAQRAAPLPAPAQHAGRLPPPALLQSAVMRFSLRHLLILVTLLAVICGEAAFVARAKHERDELRDKLQDALLEKSRAEADLIRERALSKVLQE